MARVLVAMLCAACGASAAPGAGSVERDDPRAAAGLRPFDAVLELTWRGHPVGSVRDRLVRRAGGFRFERREVWKVTRGAGVVEGVLELAIDTDADLVARRIEVTGGAGGRGRATRDDAGRWVIDVEGEAPRTWPGDAVPAELVPLAMAQRGADRWEGAVLMSGMAFAPARMTATAVGERELEVVVEAPAGRALTRVTLRADRTVERVVGGDIDAWRVDRPRAVDEPPDLVALGAVDAVAPEAVARRVVVDGAHLPALVVPDPPVSAAVRAAAERAVAGGGDEALLLARATAAMLDDDLVTGPAGSADDVLARGRGDCVAHAVLFSAMARARGIPVRLVTGYRLDGGRAVRHEWAVVERGGALVAVDPTMGGAAAGDRYRALAVHGSAAAEMALAAELAYAPVSDPRSGRSTPRTP